MLHRNGLCFLSRDHVFCQLNCILVVTGPGFGLVDDAHADLLGVLEIGRLGD